MKHLLLLLFLLTTSIHAQVFPFDALSWFTEDDEVTVDYEFEIDTLIANLSTALSDSQVINLNDLCGCIKDSLEIDSLADEFDDILVLANETSEASLKNIVKNATHATAVGSPTWTQWEGFTGATSKYLNTTYKQSVNGIRHTQNSASVGVYSRTSGLTTGKTMFGNRSATALTQINLTNSLISQYGINRSVGTANATNTNSNGMYILNRNSDTTEQFYRNGTLLGSGTVSSTGVPNVYFAVFCYMSAVGSPADYSTYQGAFFFIGSSLDATEARKLTNCVETYLDGIGKGVIVPLASISVSGNLDYMAINNTTVESHDSLRIYRGTSTNPTTWVYSIAPNETYIDSLTEGIYFYRAQVLKGGVLGDYSTTVSDTVPTAMVTFTFDDGETDNYTVAKPVFDAQEEVGCLAIVLKLLNQPSYLTTAQLTDFSNDGWEVISHTLNHVDLRGLPADSLIEEIGWSQDSLTNMGYTCNNFVFPSHYSDAASRLVADSVYNASGGQSGYYNYPLKGLAFLNYKRNALNTVDNSVNTALIDDIYSKGGWINFYTHGTPSGTLISDLIDYIQSKNIPIVTVQEAYERITAIP